MPNGNGGKKPQRAGPAQDRTVQFTANMDDLPTALCPICGCQIFNTGVALYKKLGAVQSPTGRAQLIRVVLSSCVDCGAVVMPVSDQFKLIEVTPTPPKDGSKDG